MDQIKQRLRSLHAEMKLHHLDALVITGTDPHGSEYLPDRWKTREFISGFSGSYGTIVITSKEAGLWTDTRYFLQAGNQLKQTGIKLHKLRIPGAVPPEEWLAKTLKPGDKAGVDLQTISTNMFRTIKGVLAKKGIELVPAPDFFEKIWENRPPLLLHEVFEHQTKFSGAETSVKISNVCFELKKQNADLHIFTALDELAWLLNLRGTDVIYNPVFTGFALTGKTKTILFADSRKMPAPVLQTLRKNKIDLVDYQLFYPYLQKIRNKNIYIDPSTASYAAYEAVAHYNNIVEGISIVSKLKSRKNTVEVDGYRTAMRKDGVALVEFLYWLKSAVGKENITEYSAGRKIATFRAQQEDFQGESFTPIVGYKEHGAIVHLSVKPEDALPIDPDGILLFDSGGQYLQGTTDITRTVALGNVTLQQKHDFTLVLKGMIALTCVKFPAGTLGCHLDIIARKALWDNGLNYGHGTGHGVGHFLNVHEGPMSIRQEYNPVAMEPGMVLSNEPALYREGKYGIRTENMMVCVEKEETSFGKFLGFETLSLCPIDTSLIVKELMTPEEIRWLNSYNEMVYRELNPLIRAELNDFLREQTVII